MGKNRYWTKEEIEFLQDKWGSMNVKTIAKNLNRSVDAVMLKKNRLGLGRFTESGDYRSRLSALNSDRALLIFGTQWPVL